MLKGFLFIALHSKLRLQINCNSSYILNFPAFFGLKGILCYLQYCLIMGVEEVHGLTYKLVGLHLHVKELWYEGNFRHWTYMIVSHDSFPSFAD